MSLILKVATLYIYAALSSWYICTAIRHRQAGWERARWAFPVVLLHLVVPLLLNPQTEQLFITPTAAVFSLSAFKILAYCLDRGPLALSLTTAQYVATLLVPIIPYEAFTVSGGKKIPNAAGGAPRDTWTLLADYSKQSGCACLVVLLLLSTPGLHWFPRHWLYTLSTCMFLGAVFDQLGILATALFGVQVAPTFNRPWMSDCFADFWARRWNLTTTYMMRVLVYEPAVEGHLMAHHGRSSPDNKLKSNAGGSDMHPNTAPSDTGSCSSATDSPTDGGDTVSTTTTTTTTTSASHTGMKLDGNGVPANMKKKQSSDSGRRTSCASDQEPGNGRLTGAVEEPEGRDVHNKDTTQGDKSVPNPACRQTHDAQSSRQYAAKFRPSLLRRLLALQATFMWSGVWHILIFWYNTRVISYKWAVFFIIQAPVVMAESILAKTWTRAGLPPLPRWCRIILTNAALIAMAGPFFFGPVDDHGFAERSLESLRPLLHALQHAIKLGVQYVGITSLPPSLY